MKKYNLENSLDQFESLSEIEAMEQVNGGKPIKPIGPGPGPIGPGPIGPGPVGPFGPGPIVVGPIKPEPVEPPILMKYAVFPKIDQ